VLGASGDGGAGRRPAGSGQLRLTAGEGARAEGEELWREGEARFRIAFEEAAIGMAITRHDGRWLKVNRALCATLGYTEEEMLARTFQSITHRDDVAANAECLRRALAGEFDRHEIEKRYIHKEGHVVWMALNAVLVREAGGLPPYFLAQMQDISDRKRTEALLRESEARYRQLAESVRDVFYLKDAASSSLLYLSPAYERLWGRARDGLLAVRRVPGLGVVLMSGYAEGDVAAARAGAPIAAFLKKPFTAEALRDAVRRAADSGR
jgi:PAS domain S-box-containing protein